MLAARTTMPASAKDPYLVYEIAFFQCFNFATFGKYNLSIVQMILIKYFLWGAFATIIINHQCSKRETGIPACIQKKIDTIMAAPKGNPPAQVSEYVYRGQHVFLFSGNCCDQFNVLYDGNCKYIGAPSGGLTGRGDGKCPDFNDTAKLVKLVWKDTR
jgi:hypothetical protein